jgi:hypothetical protein
MGAALMAEGIEVRVAKDGTRTYRASVWSNRDGKRIRKSFSRESEAKAWRQDAAGGVQEGAPCAPPSPPPLWAPDARLHGRSRHDARRLPHPSGRSAAAATRHLRDPAESAPAGCSLNVIS